mmetsp:Transcript_20745/g.79571  ORF Transcript_20745/g.79571 Transcript_20745/m.79571 type:complete len:205 (-) Transcript_20745:102-716(-)
MMENLRSIKFCTTSTLEQGERRIMGPTMKLGLMVASSRPRPSGWPDLMNSQAARSALVLDSGYAAMRPDSRSDQSSSEKVRSLSSAGDRPSVMDATDDVSTTRRTQASAAAALRTRSVPSTAGRMRSSLCLGAVIGNGLATWSTYMAPATASVQPSSFIRFAATSSRRSLAPSSSRRGAVLASSLGSRTVPRTRKPPASRTRTQ